MIERAEAWHLTCRLTGGEFLVQFWDTHQELFRGCRRMFYAIFQQESSFPGCYRLLSRSRHFYPNTISCDGKDAACIAICELFDDVGSEGFDVVHASEIGEHHLTF